MAGGEESTPTAEAAPARAAVKAKAFAEKMAAEEAENTEEDAKENVKPHWLQGPKVYANE